MDDWAVRGRGMSHLFTILILAAPAAAPTASDQTDAFRAFHCEFESEVDQNFDNWPDGWTRRAGRGYPRYLKIAIQKDRPGPTGSVADNPPANRSLRINLDGGAAVVYSPPIEIGSRFSYVLQADLKTEKLRHNFAFISVSLYDRAGKRLESLRSKNFQALPDWTRVRLGPIHPKHAESVSAMVELHLEPTGRRSDLVGAAMFDNVELLRLPRMALRTNRNHNLYTSPDDLQITCDVSGILEPSPFVTLEVLDVNNTVVATTRQRLNGRADEQPNATNDSQRGFAGTITWRPPIVRNGFYRVRALIDGQSETMLERDMSLVVLSEQPNPESGDFGWSLPPSEDPQSTKRLAGLLRHVGVNWVKFPVWASDEDGRWAENIAEFAERLSANKIEFIGVLDQPPKEARRLFGNGERVPVATIFVDEELWQPVVEPLVSRLSLYVRWWQIGGDKDTSFVDFPDLERTIASIKTHFEKFGQETKLGIAWHWMHQSPADKNPPWEFLSLTEDPPFTRRELESHLAGDANPTSRRWISLQPLERSRYRLDDRIQDLVTRMLAAKMGGADSVFVQNPFDAERGLMNPDGTPGELLLPWRTTALLVSGKKYIGRITMPEGSENLIFADQQETVMVVWNNRAVSETLFLGHNVRHVDLWGREETPRQAGHRQVIDVGRVPTIVRGVNRQVAEWRMKFDFDDEPLASIFGQPQTSTFRFQNTFPQGVGARIRLHIPDEWEVRDEYELKLAADKLVEMPFDILLKSGARTGVQPIQVDFEITADRTYKFSSYRSLQVGRGDVVVEVQTRLDEKGNLQVTQNMINHSDRFVSFDCLLFAPNHRRQQLQVINLGRGRNTQTFFVPNGKDLRGKTLWLRAEEMDGKRVLNYHVEVPE